MDPLVPREGQGAHRSAAPGHCAVHSTGGSPLGSGPPPFQYHVQSLIH